MIYSKFIKRFLDVVLSALLLIVTFPIFGTIVLLLFLLNRGDVFFYQKRPGQNEKPFYIIKFKTMTDQQGSDGELLPDVDRITLMGNWIRKLSLDELPQLLNVLNGDMSLIGPRPLLTSYLPLYSHTHRKRHEVKPGITGWAQVNGRNSIGWGKKLELDVYYVENLSFGLDMKIFWLTIIKIIKREGINQSDVRPMQPFKGISE